MKDFIGEMMGTFILTLMGCCSVAVAVLFGEYNSIFQIGLVWGLGVTLAIFLTRNICCAHLNPAVSVAMVLAGRMCPKRLPLYIVAQMVGAVLAGVVLYGLFSASICQYEAIHDIVRGTTSSVDTARMFGEFYPNPGDASVSAVSFPLAMCAEGFGTFLLALFIFALTEDCNVGRPSSDLQPLFIGFTVSSIIFFIAPLTQAGLNPARDLGPRIVAYLAGWGDAALPDRVGGISKAIKKEKLRVGHIKVIAEDGKQYAVGNITGEASTLQLRGSAGTSDNVKLIINARVETSPEHLDELIREALMKAIDDQYTDEILAWRYLQPGRPNPTFRITES